MTGRDQYDVIVVGGGHAGVEAAHAAWRLGAKTALVTMALDTIAQMSCNPAIGGLGKGQIVREIDALGGLMGLAADGAGIQFRMLNRSKGPAVWGPRAQADKQLYHETVRAMLEADDGLDLIEETAVRLCVRDQAVAGVVCASGRQLEAAAVVLTTGTFLRGLMHLGNEQQPGGRYGDPAADDLSQSLLDAGLELGRLKTGTPARLDGRSVDFQRLEPQYGDADPEPFSFLNESIVQEQAPCHITYTNARTHEIIRRNLDRAPLYTGQIQSTGPRYCPSIETKLIRFADKDRHQVFLEPEGLHTHWLYCNGISTSLPRDVQEEMIHSIVGLEEARILRYGYAIEYDYVPPLQIRATLEVKSVGGLFLAGQINGTSGYEEAAAQGLLAGVNAVRCVRQQPGVTLRRDQAYIGVMIDDLVTKGVDEPYRMFTSRAEHRLLLRADNADERLTPIGLEWGLVTEDRHRRFSEKQRQLNEIRLYLCNHQLGDEAAPLEQRLRQSGHDLPWLLAQDSELARQGYRSDALRQAVNDARYAGYIDKQQRLIERCRRAQSLRLPADFDYHSIGSLRFEAQERLNAVGPLDLGQAARITGINPADITVLMIHFQKQG